MRRSQTLLIVSGVIPILGLAAPPHDPTLLIYSLFVAAVLLRRRLSEVAGRVSARPTVKLAVLMVAAGLAAECFAWTGNYLKRADPAQLLHPQLIPDLILGVGFYGGWALAWTIIVRRYRFTPASAFCITGLMGIFVEANGQAFFSIAKSFPASPVLSIVMALFIASVYGSIVGLAHLPLEDELKRPGQRDGLIKYPLVVLLMYAGSMLGICLVAALATPLGLIPPRMPIWEHPFF